MPVLEPLTAEAAMKIIAHGVAMLLTIQFRKAMELNSKKHENDEWCIRAKDFSHQYETNHTNQKAISKGWISVLMKESAAAGAVLEVPFKTNLGGGCG